MIRLSVARLSKVFWEIICDSSELLNSNVVDKTMESLIDLESLREKANYNTGSISLGQALLLYLTVNFFKPKRIIEVGTFIGRSTLAMAHAMDINRRDGEIYTCDFSNNIAVPWNGETRIIQFPMQSSVAMFQKLDGEFDFLFLDGRVNDEDLINLDRLVTQNTIIALDDFEGMEKGVINLTFLRKLKKFSGHQLFYPMSESAMAENKLRGKSTLALLVPRNLIQFTNQ